MSIPQDGAVKTYTQLGLSKSKLVVGIPFYGQSYKLATGGHSLEAPAAGPGLAGEKTQQRGMLAYYEVCFRREYRSAGAIRDVWADLLN